ncbi:DUF4224 domain-containing protein [Luteimonas sp. FXH3W]|uniref:DUF4224 domain-containing protein n=1 Tax=Aquilutibacter rugosus TaxID=3115820 RepID=A0ABU7V0Z2_9GAMM
MSDLWLTPDEVAELTSLEPTSYKAQCRRLARMGIAFTPNAIGRPLVPRSLFEPKPARKEARAEPDWSKVA